MHQIYGLPTVATPLISLISWIESTGPIVRVVTGFTCTLQQWRHRSHSLKRWKYRFNLPIKRFPTNLSASAWADKSKATGEEVRMERKRCNDPPPPVAIDKSSRHPSGLNMLVPMLLVRLMNKTNRKQMTWQSSKWHKTELRRLDGQMPALPDYSKFQRLRSKLCLFCKTKTLSNINIKLFRM